MNEDIISIRAVGKISTRDYNRTFIPILKKAGSEGRKIRLLFSVGSEYDGFTSDTGLRDIRPGFKYLSLFERCAIVSDDGWIRDMGYFFGSLIPCPVHVYENNKMDEAKKWLYNGECGLYHCLDRESGVLKLEVSSPLTSASFETLSYKVGEWTDQGGVLRGIVLRVKTFPEWENFTSLLSYSEILEKSNKNIERVALCIEGESPNFLCSFTKIFPKAQVKVINYKNTQEAMNWAENRGLLYQLSQV
jgi:hypothetical protein